ncbi:MAG: pyridoxal phosphate-dependent aminotransferase [Polyangiaceae bacterium]|nr:pyridoxal phosphate-dependent aminotransferase [Polyangiaceae bacterium]
MVEFRYMRWAKAQAGRARWNLATSGLAAPPGLAASLLAAAGALDLEQRAPDMPPEARAAVARRYRVPPEHVMLTLGTSHALFLAVAALVKRGDRVWCERPAYEVLPALPPLFGAEVARFERPAAHGHRLPEDLCQRVARERPRLVLLTSPHNPTGAVLTRAELEPLARALAEVGGFLVVDEVYLEFLADPAAASAALLGPNVLVCASLTKAYGLGTLRFGWLVGAAELVARAVRYNDFVNVLYPNPGAWLGLAALERVGALGDHARAVVERNLPIVDGWLRGRSDARWCRPETGIVGLVELAKVADATAFCERLVTEHETLLVPGDFFEAPGAVRLAFGADEVVVREGLARLGHALDRL